MVSPTAGQGECWHISATGVLTAVPAMRHAARNPEHCPPRPGPTNRLAVVLACDRDLVACLRAFSGRLGGRREGTTHLPPARIGRPLFGIQPSAQTSAGYFGPGASSFAAARWRPSLAHRTTHWLRHPIRRRRRHSRLARPPRLPHHVSRSCGSCSPLPRCRSCSCSWRRRPGWPGCASRALWDHRALSLR